MSAVAAPAAVPARVTHPNPVIRVARLQLVAWPYAMAWPWGILALSFAVNLAIFGSISEAGAEGWTGGLMSIYIVQLIGNLQLFSRGFPFAMGMSVTRRAYYGGVWLYSVLESFVFGAVLLALRMVEDATDGWGMSLEYFGLGYPTQDNLVLQWLVYAVPFLLVASIGACLGIVMMRWGYNGLLTIVAGLIVVSGLAIILVTRQSWWTEIGNWFADQSMTSLYAGWPLPLVAVFALLGYAALRRATP